MALFQLKWLRRFVRRNTNPIHIDRAALWKRRLSIGYAIFAWQAFGLVCYMIYTGRSDWAKYYGYKKDDDLLKSPGQQYAQLLNIEKAKVIRFSGLTKIDEIDIDNSKDNVEKKPDFIKNQ